MILLLIVILYLFFHIKNGINKGFVRQLLSILLFVINIIIGLFFYRQFGNFIYQLNPIFFDHLLATPLNNASSSVSNSALGHLIAAFFAFLILFILISVVGRRIIKATSLVNKVPIVGFLNKFLGAILSAATGLVISYLFLLVVGAIPNIWLDQQFAQVPLLTQFINLFPTISTNIFHSIVDSDLASQLNSNLK